MKGLIEEVLLNVDKACIVRGRINKEGCKVSLKDAPSPRLIVDFDKPGSPLVGNQTRCDYLFIAEDAGAACWVSALELKRGDSAQVKLSTSFKRAPKLREKFVPQNAPVRFRPIAAFGGGMHKAERNVLKQTNNKVRFHGMSESVRLIKCGGELVQGLHP